MNRNLEANKYYTEAEQNADHVALIYRNDGSRAREYIRSLKGSWEEEPKRVQEGLKCRYRRFGTSALITGQDKIANLHQRPEESLDRYIRRALKLNGVCDGREDMQEDLSDRLWRGQRTSELGGSHGRYVRQASTNPFRNVYRECVPDRPFRCFVQRIIILDRL